MTFPSFILSTPKPAIKQRLFNGRKLPVIECHVNTQMISGWIDNPRIDIAKKHLQADLGRDDLSQDEIFQIMKDTIDVHLAELRDDIIRNGLREPITLSWSGKLLDGNRRFFAVKYALESLSPIDPRREDLVCIPAFVLTENASQEDENNVLVEENFSASLKQEWPEYIKAQYVIRAHEEGLSDKEIAKKFNWKKAKVGETLRIHEIQQDFMIIACAEKDPNDEMGGGFGLSEIEAEAICLESYQLFNEAQKSFFHQLRTEPDFKIQFFKWIVEKKFGSWVEARIAYKAYKSPQAMELMARSEPSAAKTAKAYLDYHERVATARDETAAHLKNVISFMKQLRVEDLLTIPPETREELSSTYASLVQMLGATQGNS